MSSCVANFITVIRNGQMSKLKTVSVPSSKFLVSIAALLKSEGYIENYLVESSSEGKIKRLIVSLKYYKNYPVISRIKQISRPGLRIYRRVKNLPKVINGLGTAIISTPKGLLTDRKARESGDGGEIICFVE